MKKSLGVCVLLALCGVSAPAIAETDSDTSERAAKELFARADADRDGSVSYGEFSQAVRQSVDKQVAQRFRQLDRNNDGRCTRNEVNKMDARRFARFDLNRDGAFTRAELARVIERTLSSRLLRLFARLDRNEDRSVDVAELAPRKPVDVADARQAGGNF